MFQAYVGVLLSAARAKGLEDRPAAKPEFLSERSHPTGSGTAAQPPDILGGILHVCVPERLELFPNHPYRLLFFIA
jgi:hypothetical protein